MHPQAEQEVKLKPVLAVLACVLTATTRKVVNFFEEKSAPQRKSWLRLRLGELIMVPYHLVGWGAPKMIKCYVFSINKCLLTGHQFTTNI